MAVAPLGCGQSNKPVASATGGSGNTLAGEGGDNQAPSGAGGVMPEAGTSSDGGWSEGEGGAGQGHSGSWPGGSAGTSAVGGSSAAAAGAAADGGASGTGASGGTSAGTGGAAAECTECNGRESCWSGRGDARCVAVSIPLPNGLAIDATEVTRAQYAAWLATSPDTADQAEVCAFNTSFEPDAACMAEASVCQGDRCAEHPQPCVDFCDAAAYCDAMGRGLCTEAEWTSACSADGTYDAAYGPSFVVGICNDYTAGGATTVPVGSQEDCQSPPESGFAGVFDLIGNVEEWVDDCSSSAGAEDVCRPRGLSFGIGAAAPLCSQPTYMKRAGAADNLGFRCCSPGR